MDIEKIMTYLSKTFNGFENCFQRYTVENVLIYANRTFDTLEQQLNFVVEILPEVTFAELYKVITR